MTITIYTTDTCAYCAMVKKFFDMKKLEYIVVNLDQNPERRQEVYDISGAMTVPVTIIDRGTIEFAKPRRWVIVGWNPSKLSEAIN
jgi:glutaredoxin 3